ncbi:MAG: DUF4115 domain-containing protein [Candidatus Aenigmatarchaeota archaeon]
MNLSELCNKIKQKREELNLNIEEVVEKTKLYPSVIRDIEDGNLKNIEPAYLKGFIKIYASFLGIDVGEALEEIDTFSQVERPKEKIKRKNKKELIFFTPWFKKIFLFSILGVLVILVIVIFGNSVFKKISNIFKVKKIESEKITNTSNIYKTNIVPQRLNVSVKAKRSCFLKVAIDNKVLFEGILEKGKAEFWEAQKIIELKINDPSCIYLEVDGKPIPLIPSLKKKIAVKITPEGISVEK